MITQSPPGLKARADWKAVVLPGSRAHPQALPRCQAMAQHCLSSDAGGVGRPPIKMH